MNNIKLIRSLSLVVSFVITVALFNSCKRDKVYTGQNNNQTVQATIFGQVIAEDGKPMKDAVVKVGTSTCVTDSSGVFHFSKISTAQNATLITVTKTNYFTGYRTLKITPNKDHYTRIMMIEMKNPVYYNAVTGATVNVSGGGTITFPANGMMYKSDGTPYGGIVTVYAKWLDPTGNNLNELMPGDLRGTDTSNTEKILQTFGMIGVELFDNANQPLQIANNKTAQLSFPIPSSIDMHAPSVIPLWFFDANTGMWKEEGSATKQGSNYIGDVKHFSFWNCDVPGTYVNLDLTLTDNAGSPLVSTVIKITNVATGAVRYGCTNSSGYVSGLVPDNAILTLEVIMYPCMTPIYSQTVNTLSSPISLGTIAIALPVLNVATVTATVLDCSGNLVSNGYVSIDGKIVATNTAGIIKASLLICILPSTVTVTAYDMNANVSGSSTANLSVGANNLGMLTACGTPLGYIQWTSTVGSVSSTFSIHEPFDYFLCYYATAGATVIYAQGSPPINIKFVFDGTCSTTGSHNLMKGFLDQIEEDTLISPVPVTITNYQPIGGFIEGSFTGDFHNNVIPLRTITCNFRVRRQ